MTRRSMRAFKRDARGLRTAVSRAVGRPSSAITASSPPAVRLGSSPGFALAPRRETIPLAQHYFVTVIVVALPEVHEGSDLGFPLQPGQRDQHNRIFDEADHPHNREAPTSNDRSNWPKYWWGPATSGRYCRC